jgi:hypothetical protein
MRRGGDLRSLLETLDPKARDDLRSFLIRDQADRDWADIIDFLTTYPDAGRQVARLLGEIDATQQP